MNQTKKLPILELLSKCSSKLASAMCLNCRVTRNKLAVSNTQKLGDYTNKPDWEHQKIIREF